MKPGREAPLLACGQRAVAVGLCALTRVAGSWRARLGHQRKGGAAAPPAGRGLGGWARGPLGLGDGDGDRSVWCGLMVTRVPLGPHCLKALCLG